MRTRTVLQTSQDHAAKAQAQRPPVPAVQGIKRHDPAASLLHLQRTLGNHYVQQLLHSRFIQAKLTISQPDDPAEIEADRVAETVMRMPEHVSNSAAAAEGSERLQIQRVCVHCEDEMSRQTMGEEDEEENLMQAKELPGHSPVAQPDVEASVQSLKGRGQPLSQAERAFFEPRFGYDFSQVRVHSDAGAAESARAVNARAYTVGRDVVFGAGEYAPDTLGGRRLLAHELTHVVQQRDAVQPKLVVGTLGDKFEQEADEVARTVMLQERVAPQQKESNLIRRDEKKPGEVQTKKNELTKEDVANIIGLHIIDYREQVKSGIDGWSIPEEKQSSVWFLIALGGNLVWAATCFVNPMAGAVIKAMSVGGAIIGSGTMEKVFKNEAKPTDIRPLLVKQVSAYVDSLKQNISDETDSIYAYFRLRDRMSPASGWMDADQKIHERREIAWRQIFDNKVAPWGNSTAIITNTTNEVGAIWEKFKPSFDFIVLSIHGYPRYKGKDLEDKVLEVYYAALITSGVADRSPAVKTRTQYEQDLREYKVYEFPSPGPGMTGAKVKAPTGNVAIPVELVD